MTNKWLTAKEIVFDDGAPRKHPVIIMLQGEAGCGKSLSAIKIGSGMIGNGKLGVADCDWGRGTAHSEEPEVKKLRDEGKYLYTVVKPPYHPTSCKEVIEAFVANGVTCGIIDPLTVFWDGTGGMHDLCNSQTQWALYKNKAWNPLREFIRACGIHIIFTVREFEVSESNVTDSDMKGEKRKVSMEKQMPSMVDVRLRMTSENPGVIRLLRKMPSTSGAGKFDGKLATREFGEMLAKEANTGIIDPLSEIPDIVNLLKSSAGYGKEALDRMTKELPQADKDRLAKLPPIVKQQLWHELNHIASEWDNQYLEEKPKVNKDGM